MHIIQRHNIVCDSLHIGTANDTRYYDDYVLKQKCDFIERHEFVQFIHALDESCRGYVILGRQHQNALELLLLDVGCIHGDAQLVGLYLMGMTGNHTAMQTADTVLFKNNNTQATTPMEHSFFKIMHQPLMTHHGCDATMLKRTYKQLERMIDGDMRRLRPWTYLFRQYRLRDDLHLFKNVFQ